MNCMHDCMTPHVCTCLGFSVYIFYCEEGVPFDFPSLGLPLLKENPKHSSSAFFEPVVGVDQLCSHTCHMYFIRFAGGKQVFQV